MSQVRCTDGAWVNEGERAETLREVRRLLRGLMPEMPRYRYVSTRDGWMFCWSTERVQAPTGRSTFAAFIYRPIGTGSRSGEAARWQLQRIAYRARRKDAKALAQRWYEARLAKDRASSRRA